MSIACYYIDFSYTIFFAGNPDLLKFISNLFLFQAFIPSQDYYFSLNAPSWSISVEFFLYLLFPLLIKFRNSYLIVVSIFFIIIKCMLPIETEDTQHAFLYISPLFRIADFSIGILIYRYRRNIFNHTKSVIVNCLQFSSVIILLLFIYFSSYANISYRYDIYYIIPMSLLILSLSFNYGLIGKLLSGRAIVLLGEASFSLYMTHQLVIRYLLKINERFNLLSDGLLLISIISLCLIVSVIFYKFIEIPMKNWTYEKLMSIYKKKN
ncbi:acyltransferase family protein [Providencia sp. 2.29]|uniref:acyltransferase family protein n=1 Tax=Providencia sp. 2.29 TaxID=2791982 RepID=UPI0034D6368F